MNTQEKQEKAFEKMLELGGPRVGILAFGAPFMALLLAKDKGMEMLLWLALALFASAAIIGSFPDIKNVFLSSARLQKRVLQFSILNLGSIFLLPAAVSIFVVTGTAVIIFLVAKEELGTIK